MKAWIATFLTLAVVLPTSLAAAAGGIEVSHGWSRLAPPTASVLGGFLNITNNTDAPDRLLSASSAISDDVQIHQTSVKDGRATMRRVKEAIDIPSGATLKFGPGGYHLMFMKPKERPAEGATIPVTLEFAVAGKVETTLKVSKAHP